MPNESTKFNADRAVETGEIVAYTKLAVGWGKELGEVQVSIHVESADGKTGKVLTAVTSDRHVINRLIRQLRKARDQAFGADA